MSITTILNNIRLLKIKYIYSWKSNTTIIYSLDICIWVTAIDYFYRHQYTIL